MLCSDRLIDEGELLLALGESAVLAPALSTPRCGPSLGYS
jgi:hypothetical protein